MKILFEDRAWSDYLYWQVNDKKTLKRINLLINDIKRNPFDGLGKVEPLRNNLFGTFSRRIYNKNRIVYFVSNEIIYIISCKGYYE